MYKNKTKQRDIKKITNLLDSEANQNIEQKYI